MSRAVFVVLAFVVVACRGPDPVTFSPLLKSPPDGGWDILVQGITHIRSTELAPGAQPARPVIEGRTGTKRAHFIATYAGAVTPEEIGASILETFREAPFLKDAPSVETDAADGFGARIEYATESVGGVLELRIRSTDRPHCLDVFYTVREEAR